MIITSLFKRAGALMCFTAIYMYAYRCIGLVSEFMHGQRKKSSVTLSLTMLIQCSRIFFFIPGTYFSTCMLVLWDIFWKYKFWCMSLVFHFKWGNKPGNINGTTSKGYKTFYSWYQLWASHKNAVRVQKMRAWRICGTPGKLYLDDEFGMGRTDRWDLNRWEGCLWWGGKGILGLEKNRMWEGGGNTVLVLDGSEYGQPEVWLHRSSGYWEDVILIGDTRRASWQPKEVGVLFLPHAPLLPLLCILLN